GLRLERSGTTNLFDLLTGSDNNLYIQASVTALVVQASTGYLGVGTIPSYPLHVIGDVNCTGTYRVNGTAIGGGITTQNNVTASRGNNVSYQNTTGKPMYVMQTAFALASGNDLTFYADASNPPTTIHSRLTMSGNNGWLTVTSWVLPGHYYMIAAGGAGGVRSDYQWTEWY